jgi:hypothetical protein
VSEEIRHDAATRSQPQLTHALIILLKGVLYRDQDASIWSCLLTLRAQVTDYVGQLGLDLLVDEAEGYAFLRTRLLESGEDDGVPRLVARRPLSFYDSLLLALLRKKLAEFDAAATETRLILKWEQILDLVQLFLPERSDETKLHQRIEQSVNRLQEMGFLRRLKSTTEPPTFEVLRIIKAFVDAQWLEGLEASLAAYRNHAIEPKGN